MSKEKISLLLITIIFSLLAGIAIGNIARKNFLAQDANETLEYCEQDDGVKNCEIKWEYTGIVLVNFKVIGEGV